MRVASLLNRTSSARASYMFWRPEHDDRSLQSLHDWYGAGVLRAFGVDLIDGQHVNWFCGKGTAQASYLQGVRDGRVLRDAK